MAFVDTFRRTQPELGAPARVNRWLDVPLEAGVYENGLLVLLGNEPAWDYLGSWPILAEKRELLPVAYTGLGDVFLVNEAAGDVFMLNVQDQTLPKAALHCKMLLDSILVRPRILDELLRRDRVNELVGRLGSLEYLQCFILEPWLMAGGDDVVENYVKGDVRTYVNLVGQVAFSSGSRPS
jgi:hypothetical protein